MKKFLISIAFLAILVILHTTVPAQTKTSEKETVAVCSGEQLSFREAEGEADIGGKRFGNYVFTNVSQSRCTLSGFPTFVLLNKAGRVMRGSNVEYKNSMFFESEEEVGNKPPQVTLEPGKTAWFQIYYNDGMALDHKKPYPISAKVEVKAPNTTRKFILKSEIQSCCGVQVSSIRSGLPGQEEQ